MRDNFSVNFSLKGITSILIGFYFLGAAYSIKYIINSFLIKNNTLGMLSPQLIEFLIIGIAFFVFLLSSLAFFFRGKRLAKRFKYTIWNKKTKAAFWKYLISIAVLFLILFLLKQQGYINFITPVFLIIYGVVLFLFRNKENKNYLILPLLCLVLATLCFLIPSYWYSSLSILGIAHITYGVVVRN